MIHPKLMIWSFLLVAVFGLCLHVFLLWRNVLIETCSLELLRIEAAIASLRPPQFQSTEAVRRLRRLLANCRLYAGSLIFTRILLASVLLPSRARAIGSCRDSLLAMDDTPSREASLGLYAQFERAVACRMAAASPILWLFLLYRNLVQFRGGSPTTSIPGFDLLELTFAEGPGDSSEGKAQSL